MNNNLKKAELTAEGVIRCSFPYDFALIQKIKELPNRRFLSSGKGKYWTIPVSLSGIEHLEEWGFKLSDELQQLKIKLNKQINKTHPVVLAGLKGTLFPFQRHGLEFLERKNGRALIADEMGLGKTVQALAYLQLHPELRPAIIICPASLKLNWAKEAERWMSSPRCEIIGGKNPYFLNGQIIIINYDVLYDWVDTLRAIQPKVIITDECHYYKSNTTRRTKAIKKLAKGVPHFIALSGTPIINRPIEIYNAVNLIDPDALPTFWVYAQRYCGARHNGFGWDFSGATNQQELHNRLIQSVMIRRLKQDVLRDLPDKVRSFVPIELNNASEYAKAEQDFIRYLLEKKGIQAAQKAKGAETLVKIETLKQLAVEGKLQQAINWIRDFLESGEKLVVFAVHKSTMDYLMKEFPKISVKIDGSTTIPNRQKAVDMFQNDPNTQLFVGNIQAAGVGITLTKSSNVAFLELPWTPGALVQAEDRCHRIGQQDSVTIWFLLAAHTIEERIAHLLDSKRKVLDRVLDGVETEEDSLLSELIKGYTN
jgi:SNF2 family DNA or RNA helicase